MKDNLVLCRSFTGHHFSVPYDLIVVAVGAKNNTFSTPGVSEHYYFLKEIKHARRIRHKLLSLLEEASLPGLSREQRERMLHVVVVGGGPTGVEFAAEFHDLLVQDIRSLFPDLAHHVSLTLIQSEEHILNTYDAKISEYAEQQFIKEDIRLITGAHVHEVTSDRVLYEDIKTKQMLELPYGLAVWATGIDTVRFTKQLKNRLGDEQKLNSKVLLTNNRLQVKGAMAGERIYAIGDAASVTLPSYLSKHPEHLKLIFKQVDKEGDGVISFNEFEQMVQYATRKYPLLKVWLGKRRICDLFDNWDVNKSNVMEESELEACIEDIKRKTKSYPATAQVASQQGRFLACRFNLMGEAGWNKPQEKAEELDSKLNALPNASLASAQYLFELTAVDSKKDKPFAYKHFASLAYIGNENAAVDLGEGRSLNGWKAYWLWRSIYLSTSVSMHTRMLLLSDWVRSYLFGRDVSRR